MMNRKCFICNGIVKNKLISSWNIPNISTVKEIGFGICPTCQVVLQTPTIDEKDMYLYYEDTATYINPTRGGKPSLHKVKDVKRQLDFLQNSIDIKSISNCFQIGCSDGYTLSQIKNLKIKVDGIDPSTESHKLAKRLYEINTQVGVFEEYSITTKYDLIVITHILEHIYNPNDFLKKCNKMLNRGASILLEVPLFENNDRFPIGMFTLEHLNYFTEYSLKKLFSLNGLELISTEKLYYNNNYPVISMIFQKDKPISLSYVNFQDTFQKYVTEESLMWKTIEENILAQTQKDEKIYIWGGGIHTTQLLAYTNIESHVNIKGIIDSSVTKQNKLLGKYKIYPANSDIVENYTIIISSYASEKEIAKFIEKNYKYTKYIKLYKDK